jgi:hypothetical protein
MVRRAALGVVTVGLSLLLGACSSSSSPSTPGNSGPGTSTTSSSSAPTPSCTIPQNNGGDHDADNNGGPSDGDGCDK